MVHSFFVKNVAVVGAGDLQLLATGVRDKWMDYLNSPIASLGTIAPLYSNSTQFLKVAAYKIDPLTSRASDVAEASFAPSSGGTTASNVPTELAICATILTGAPGRSSRGRLYLGGFSQLPLLATGRINASQADMLAQGLARFFRAIRTIQVSAGQQDAWEPQVVSQVRTSARKITAVSVGDVWDVQRRRGNKLVEARTTTQVG